MSKSRPRYVPKPFESDGRSSDTSANIYMSMLTHQAYTSLTPKQQQLYTYCKAQYYAEKNKTKPNEFQEPTLFTMNRSKYALLYHLYSSNDSGGFIKDMSVLIEHGLIDCIRRGQSARVKSVYGFSNRWQDYGKPDYTVPYNVMTDSMIRKKKAEESEQHRNGNVY